MRFMDGGQLLYTHVPQTVVALGIAGHSPRKPVTCKSSLLFRDQASSKQWHVTDCSLQKASESLLHARYQTPAHETLEEWTHLANYRAERRTH